MELPDLIGQLRYDLEEISHDPVVRDFEDRRVFVFVDRDDDLRRAHAREVLDRAGDSDGDVERWAHGLTGLSDLIGVRAPARIYHRARSANCCLTAECLRQLFEHFEIRRLLETAAT